MQDCSLDGPEQNKKIQDIMARRMRLPALVDGDTDSDRVDARDTNAQTQQHSFLKTVKRDLTTLAGLCRGHLILEARKLWRKICALYSEFGIFRQRRVLSTALYVTETNTAPLNL